MKQTKKLALLACIVLSAVSVRAEEDFALLYPAQESISTERGKSFNLVLDLDNTIIPSTFQFFVGAPEGITVKKNKLKYDITYNSERLDPDVYTLNALNVEGTNDVVFIVYNLLDYNNEEGEQYKIQPGTGTFATIVMDVDSEMETGEYELQIYDILFVTLDEDQYRSPNATVKVYVNMDTSVSDLQAEDGTLTQTRYFDISGRPVGANDLTPGLYVKIANGKAEKLLIK